MIMATVMGTMKYYSKMIMATIMSTMKYYSKSALIKLTL